MIHLDTSFISTLSNQKNLRDKFFEYLESTNEEILLNSDLLIELTKSSNKVKVAERLDFLKTIPRKRLLTIPLFDVVFQEIAYVFANNRIRNNLEFRDIFTVAIDSAEDLENQFNIAQKEWDETNSIFRGWHGTQLFGKTTSAFKVIGAEKLTVRDYLKLDPSSSCSLFTKDQAVRKFDQFSHDNSDIFAYCNYIHLFERMNNSSGQELLEWLNHSISVFHFPEYVLEWPIMKFFDQVCFLRKCKESLKFLPDNMRNLDKMYLELNTMDLRDFPSFFFISKLTNYLKTRQSNQKPGDLFDTFYVVLLPYLSLFSCDNDIYTCLNSLVTCNCIKCSINLVNFKKFKKEFLKI